jgi:hypothetical protein
MRTGIMMAWKKYSVPKYGTAKNAIRSSKTIPQLSCFIGKIA